MSTRTRGIALIMAFASVASATTTMAATEEQKLAAIQNGLANLYNTQQPGGYWSFGGFEPAATGAAVLAFASQKDKWDSSNEAAYQGAVDNAVAYLLNNATKTTVSLRNDGVNICPGGSGDCPAVYWNAASNEDSYTTGLIMPALMTYAAGKAGEVATDSGPLAGMTWGEIAQANTNLWAASQSTANQGNRQGGWRYVLGVGGYDSDMSTTQWGIISLIYNETLGAITPAIVKTDLQLWLAAVQAADGSACYQPGAQPCDHSDTGGLLLGLKFVGQNTADPAVQSALTFLNTNWTQTAFGTWYGNFGHPYATWSVYKGLEVNIGLDDTIYITNLYTDCGSSSGNLPGNPPGSKPCNWWEDYNEYLVNSQNADGSWTGYSYWYGPLATAFYVNILGATSIPVAKEVPVDIHPTSCPNPINTQSKGVTPVAILGTEDFDVSSVDPATVQLLNPSLPEPQPAVAPLRWALEDVATPYEPYVGKPVDAYACNEYDGDGYMDLTLKFKTQEVVGALGAVSDRDVLVLELTGKLKEEFGGTDIVGEDVVVILKKK